MIDPALGGGSLLDMGPYPSVWAMLALFQHPDNNRTPPKMLTSYQTLYPRSGVDLNSRWLLEFPGLDNVQALLTTDMDTTGCGDMTALISCQHADLAIACESSSSRADAKGDRLNLNDFGSFRIALGGKR